MRVVHLTPGSGDNFYCENCLRDHGTVKALREMGLDAILVPLYLPPRLKETGLGSTAPIFFGGINVYLQQKFSLFRRTPRWLDRLLDSPGLLRWAARKAGMTRARDLGETTLSMLRGEEGRQAKELERLVSWLASSERPDVVCLSNALLSGTARRIKETLSAAVVCLLQDEDQFLDSLPEPYAREAWDTLRERARDVDRFVAVSRYYAGVMEKRLDLPEDSVDVAYTGLDLEGFFPAPAPPRRETIGFLSRACPDKGLDLLVEAFLLLRKKDRLGNIRLRIAGGSLASDRLFIHGLCRKLEEAGAEKDVEFLQTFELKERQEFLRSLSVLSVPEKSGEACGRYVLEALASGVPAVLPTNGVFPELSALLGGLLLYEPNTAEALASALERLLLDPDRARDLGEKGRSVIIERFTIEEAAGALARVFEKTLQQTMEH